MIHLQWHRTKTARVIVRWVAVCSVLLGGCDVLGAGDLVYAGVVVEQGTGVPLAGIHVSTQIVGAVGNSSTTAETLTAADGSFRLRSRRGALFVNAPGYGREPGLYNAAYSGGVFLVGDGDPERMRIALVGPGTPSGAP